MAKIKPLTKQLKEEFNSEAFISGLEAILNFTNETGREASFAVEYIPSADIFHYPYGINLGDKNSMRYAAEQRIKSDKEISDAIKRGDEEAIRKSQKEFHEKTSIDYPKTQDFVEKREESSRVNIEYRLKKGLKSHPGVKSFDIHTHPNSDIAIPSQGDLKVLYNDASKFFENSEFNVANPVKIIAGAKEANGSYDLLFVQEKERPSENEFDNLSKGFDYRDYRNAVNEPLLKSITGEALPEQNSEEKRINEVYNIVNAKYVPPKRKDSKGRIEFADSLAPFSRTSYSINKSQ